jgi:hypothetical protein
MDEGEISMIFYRGVGENSIVGLENLLLEGGIGDTPCVVLFPGALQLGFLRKYD